jgi:cell division protein FtsW (lipid II flippase)
MPHRRNAELLLVGFATVITAAALLLVSINQQQPLGWDLLRVVLAYLTLFTLAHLVIRRYALHADPLLLPIVAVLNGLGVVMIYRLDLEAALTSGPTQGPSSATLQLGWTLLGVLGFCVVVIVLKDYRVLARYGYLCGAAGLILLAIPAVLPSSISEANGAKIWIRLPGVSIEPAEFAKILLIVFLAAVLVAKRGLFASAGTRVLGMNLPRPRDVAPMLGAWVLSVAVMVCETDLGASLLVYATFLVMVYLATARISWALIGVTLFAAGAVAAYHLFGHVQIRVQNWLDPFLDPDGTGYQMVQSLFSFAAGGLFGTGLGNGQPGIIPVASSDFIIAAYGEELGLVGLTAVLMLYTILIMRALRTAITVRDTFGKLLAAGLAVTVAFQVFLVVGGVTKLIPQTGLTTPWMSYGGSSLLANYVLLAILMRISHAARGPVHPRPPQTPIADAGTEVITRTRHRNRRVAVRDGDDAQSSAVRVAVGGDESSRRRGQP